MRLTRRELLRGGAAAATGLGVSACRSGDPYSADKPPLPGTEAWRRFEERQVRTACAQCSARCGVSVRVVEGRAVRIDGTADNPINRGGIGPRGIAGVQVLYDPDRIRQPLVRRKGELVPIAWKEALEIVSARLSGLRTSGRADAFAIACGRDRGMVRDLWQRLALAFGTPNFLDRRSVKGGGLRAASKLMMGFDDVPAYDWHGAGFVLSLGAGLLTSSCQSVYFARMSADLRRGPTGRRARIVHVEPSYSRTAAHADEWLAIAPGSYAAFVLALCHVLVREERYDHRFVSEWVQGFDSWRDADDVEHPGFRAHVLEHCSPDLIAADCGVDAAKIEQLARNLIERGPAVAVFDAESSLGRDGLQASMAVFALNALLGRIQRPGGVVEQATAPLAEWAPVELDEIAQAALQQPPIVRANVFGELAFEGLAAALAQRGERPIDTLVLDYANPCYAAPDSARWRRALAGVPFVVTTSPFLDETSSAVADLVLPDHTYLERFEDAQPAPSTGTAVFGVVQPAVEPLYDTRSTADVVIEIGRALGGAVATAFPWKEFRFAFAQRVLGLHRAQRGSIVASSPKAFFRDLFREGFWADAAVEAPELPARFATPSGRIELAPQALRTALLARAAEAGMEPGEFLASIGLPSDLDEAILPHAPPRKPPSASKSRGTIRLDVYRPSTYAEGSGANLPMLQELVTQPTFEGWSTTASIAPETAGALGLRDGERIMLTSPVGSISAPVRLVRGVHPGIIRVPRGGGHTAFGRFARGIGANAMDLLPLVTDPLFGYALVTDEALEVSREVGT